ncbi:hypothetical protein D3C80_1001570 [compost metagenome]
MIGAVVVGAVGDQGRQTVGTTPGAHQMVAGGLGGRVGAARSIGGRFSKERQRLAGSNFIRVGQVAIYLIGRDMVEAEGRFACLVQTVPICTCGFQQHVGTDDIGFDEIGRAGDGAIDVALCRQMHNGVRLVGGKDPIQFGAVADIYLLEGIAITA